MIGIANAANTASSREAGLLCDGQLDAVSGGKTVQLFNIFGVRASITTGDGVTCVNVHTSTKSYHDCTVTVK